MEENHTHVDMSKYYDRFVDLLETMKKDNPKYVEAFMGFFREAEKPGALDTKTKELISLAIGVKAQCAYCIAFHAKNAIRLGATRQEIMEAGYVATLMGGGPAITYLRYVVDACDQFGAK